jgi:cell division protein FtsQ
MRDFASVSRSELAERRQRLRRQRRIKVLQASWRSLVVLGITGSMVWFITRPNWVIRNAQQVEIRGNKLLSTKAVQSLLPIAYPQSLLQLKPQTLAHQLEQRGSIANAVVTRHLFPPGLTVQIQERDPVAIAYPITARTTSVADSQRRQVGLLDKNGTWMSLESYTSFNRAIALPKLKVIGMQDQYRSQWITLYQAVSSSPVKISEIDWRQPSNLILKTELGVVHCGFYSPQFSAQLKALDQMRLLPKTVNPSQIAYINLKNPSAPSIEMIQDQSSPKPVP